ncbi:MAG: hypothetical protein GY870_21660, partial [archaeon]|nr:hypothetical protein [archaeon]
ENKNKEESDKSEKITGRIISFKPTAIQKVVIIGGLLAVASIVISIVIIHSMRHKDKVYAFNFSTSILLKNNEKIQFNTSIYFKSQRKMLTAQAKLEKIYFALSQSLHEFTSDELIAKGEERRKESLKKVIKNTLTTEDIEIHIYGYKIVANHNKGEG